MGSLCHRRRSQSDDAAFECLDDWIDENNPVRVIGPFSDVLDLAEWASMGLKQRSLATRKKQRNIVYVTNKYFR